MKTTRKTNKGTNDTIRKLIDRADDVFFYLVYSYTTRRLVGESNA